MMESRWLWLLVTLAGMLVHSRVEATNTFEMTWAKTTFGPDGPWHAVQISIGATNRPVALYPGGSFASHILSPSVCSNASLGLVCSADQAGVYDHTLSSTAAFGDIAITAGIDFSGGALQMGGEASKYGSDNWNIGNAMETLIGMDMAVHDSVWATLPDGTLYPVTVGSLALGAPGTINQTFGFNGGRAAINLTLLGGYLENYAPSNKVLSSNSYGMHIGSVSPAVPPSLQMGGFDQNRALGNVSAQQGQPEDTGSIDLIDIGLNVVTGSSPFNFTGSSLGGLLASGNSSITNALPVAINSLNPYLSLPKSACDAIAANLPVTYNSSYGLYLWNTTAPQYQKIVTSPSVLTFTFRSSDSSNNLTIKVPFSLLNLNLTAPITTGTIPYFPCQPTTWTNYQLGRAFMQAAFVGVNYDAYGGKAAWFLAQAPGPNTPTQSRVLAMGDTDMTITGSTDDWADTWKGSWTPLTQADVSPTTTASGANSTSSSTSSPSSSGTGVNKNTSSGLSIGAKAGIGVAAAAAVIAALLGAFLLFRRHKKNTEAGAPADYATVPMGPNGPYYEPAKPPMQQYAQQTHPPPSPTQTQSTYHASSSNGYPQSPPVELNSEPVRHELN